ncbi:hypothetical protein D3C85_952000 [compost metagenome]
MFAVKVIAEQLKLIVKLVGFRNLFGFSFGFIQQVSFFVDSLHAVGVVNIDADQVPSAGVSGGRQRNKGPGKSKDQKDHRKDPADEDE